MQAISASAARGPVPDPAEHLAAHHEADRADGLDEQPGPWPRVPVSLPHDEPRCPARLVLEHESPGEVVGGRGLPYRDPAEQNQGPTWLNGGHGEGDLRREPDLVADLDVLPLGHDAIRAADIAADQVLQEVVTVEPAPPLPDLHDPRPYLAGRGPDGDGAGGSEISFGDEVVAGQRLAGFLAGGTPSKLAEPAEEHIGSHRAARDGQARIPTPHSVLPRRSRVPHVSFRPS